jgi:conjugative transfer region protein TrbK
MTETPPESLEDAAPVTGARRPWSRRALAIALGVPALGIAALLALREPAPSDPRYSVTDSRETESKRARDPLAAELARCRTLAADQVDERCQAAWETNRRRFYGESRSLVIPKADVPAAELPAIDPHARSMEP